MTDAPVRPFSIDVPQADLDELHARLDRARWPDALPGAGWAHGVPLSYLKELVAYWRTAYDWRKHEARINEFPQFTTIIDGQNVHFLHVRSPEPDALPLLVTHGWPGSIVELLDVIGPLTDPWAHGGEPPDAFHLVVPSIPGFGLSGPTREPGWHVGRVARAWAELMQRLGYNRYGAQGSDLGALVSTELGRIAPDRVVGIHADSAMVGFTAFGVGDVDEDADDEDFYQDFRQDFRQDVDEDRGGRVARDGFVQLQATRPQTLAFGLADSPVGQLAWIVEHFKGWSPPDEEFAEAAVDRDLIITNVMLHWLTGTAASAGRLYYENLHAASGRPASAQAEPAGRAPSGGRSRQLRGTPPGVAAFAGDIASRCNGARGDLSRSPALGRGGPLAAMDASDLLVSDVRASFRACRSAA